jgi:hypothetical protein
MRLVLLTIKRFLENVVSNVSGMREFISAPEEIDEKLIELQRLSWTSELETISNSKTAQP